MQIPYLCDALQICRKMKAVFGDVNIPIVMCTALSAGSKGLRNANEAGSVDVLLKPYDRKRMLEVVEKHVGKQKVGRPSVRDLHIETTSFRQHGQTNVLFLMCEAAGTHPQRNVMSNWSGTCQIHQSCSELLIWHTEIL